MKTFDIIVIGTGAGLMVAQAAIANGKTCAIIENSKFGGTCLTKGCIPSKMLVYPADVIRESQRAKRIGLKFTAPEVDFENISQRMWQQINFSEKLEHNLSHIENLEVFKGTAEFLNNDVLRVRYKDGSFSDEIHGDIVVLAAGARSFVPPIEGLQETGYITSESFFGDEFPKQPWKSLIIIGGGAIGAEFTHIFSAFGTKVSLIEMRSNIIASEEEEISEFIKTEFQNNGVDVYTDTKIINAKTINGKKALKIQNTKTGETRTIEADEILVSSGVRSNADFLNIEKTDIKVDERSWIKTNEYLETSQKNIYAIGDINGKFQFRHKANYEAEILMHNIFSKEKRKKARYDAVPWAIFTSPQVGHVGMTEREAKAKGIKYWIGKNYYSQIAGGISMGITKDSPDNGFVKIIIGEEKSILGVHIVGPYASILVQAFVYLMNANYKCEKSFFLKDKRQTHPPLGNFLPINDSMIIHPSFNELTAWVFENIQWSGEEI